MKKIACVLGVCGAVAFAASDGYAAAKNGDTVMINFMGLLDGEQFAGGTAENFPLKLGSGQFVPGFEEQLVGAEVGEERDVKLTFPTNYVPHLAGKDVVFKVKVLEIKTE